MTGLVPRVARQIMHGVARALAAVTSSTEVFSAHCLTSRGGTRMMRTGVSATDSKLKWALKYLSIGYVLLLAAGYVALTLLEIFKGNERTEFGCYYQVTMSPGPLCKGFMGAAALEFILNVPVVLSYAPLLGVAGLIEGPYVLRPLLVLGVGLALWLPIIYAAFHVRNEIFAFVALALTMLAWALARIGTLL